MQCLTLLTLQLLITFVIAVDLSVELTWTCERLRDVACGSSPRYEAHRLVRDFAKGLVIFEEGLWHQLTTDVAGFLKIRVASQIVVACLWHDRLSLRKNDLFLSGREHA